MNCLGPIQTGNRFLGFAIHQNQNWSVIGCLLPLQPKLKICCVTVVLKGMRGPNLIGHDLKSAGTHLLIISSSYFTSAPGCTADVPVFMFTKLSKKFPTPTCAPCAQSSDLRLRRLMKVEPLAFPFSGFIVAMWPCFQMLIFFCG